MFDLEKRAAQSFEPTGCIDKDSENQRLDNFLLKTLKGVPRSRVYRAISSGEVRINSKRCKPKNRLRIGDQVRIPHMLISVSKDENKPREVSHALREQISNSVLFEDKQLLVINKPAGLAVHGGSGIPFGVIEILRSMSPPHTSFELVHRLDRETSGCLMIAKKRSTLRFLHEALRENKIRKYYLAVVIGTWPKKLGLRSITKPLKAQVSPHGQRIMHVSKDGKEATTGYRVLNHFQGLSLVQMQPVTGRMHQIRVHATAMGYPVLGDKKYRIDKKTATNETIVVKSNRLFLHAGSLSMHGQNGKFLKFSAPLPNHFKSLLKKNSIDHEEILNNLN